MSGYFQQLRTFAIPMFVVVCVSGLMGCSTSEWIEVKCPEQQFATRLPRNANSAYHHYGSMYETGYTAIESALERLLPSISPSDTLRIMIEDFRRYLVGEHDAVQSQLQRSVVALQENPCDNNARKRFQYLIQYINFNGHYLHNIAAACKDSTSKMRTMLEEYRRENN